MQQFSRTPDRRHFFDPTMTDTATHIHSKDDPDFSPADSEGDGAEQAAPRSSSRARARRCQPDMVNLDYVAPGAFTARLGPKPYPALTRLIRARRDLERAKAGVRAAKDTAARAERELDAAKSALIRNLEQRPQ